MVLDSYHLIAITYIRMNIRGVHGLIGTACGYLGGRRDSHGLSGLDLDRSEY